MSKIIQKAFTLIELLTVVAIIGLLASVLLVRVRQSQLRAHDSAIQQTFDTLRTTVARDFHNNGDYDAVCDDNYGILTTTGEYFLINENIKSNNGGNDVKCYESQDKQRFAAWSPLREEPGTFWCVDWRYIFVKLDAEPANGSWECP